MEKDIEEQHLIEKSDIENGDSLKAKTTNEQLIIIPIDFFVYGTSNGSGTGAPGRPSGSFCL